MHFTHKTKIAAWLAFCLTIPAGSAATAQPLGQGNAEWQKTVKAAQGSNLNMMVMTGNPFARVIQDFQKAYPGIKVRMTQARPGQSTARIVTEQKNGQFNWDIFWGPNNSVTAVLIPAKGVQDMRPFFILPSVTADANWLGGFPLYFQNVTKRTLTFMSGMNVQTGGFAVNWDMVPKGSIKGWQDLLDSKWRGKIVIYKPTRPITGAIALSCALPIVGEDYIRKLLRTQKLITLDNARLITDWIVRRKVPVVIGLSSSYLPKYQKRGLGKNIETVGASVCNGAGGPGLNVLRNAPNPDATKVFINWFLSKPGQEVFNKRFWKSRQIFSRRTDVAQPNTPEAKATIENFKKGDWVATGTETHRILMKKVLAITRAYFRGSKRNKKKKK